MTYILIIAFIVLGTILGIILFISPEKDPFEEECEVSEVSEALEESEEPRGTIGYRTPDEMADRLTTHLYTCGFIAKSNYNEIQNEIAYILARLYYGDRLGKEEE